MAGPRPVVLSGPSGAGKSTLLKKLMKEYNNVFGFSVSRKWAARTPIYYWLQVNSNTVTHLRRERDFFFFLITQFKKRVAQHKFWHECVDNPQTQQEPLDLERRMAKVQHLLPLSGPPSQLEFKSAVSLCFCWGFQITITSHERWCRPGSTRESSSRTPSSQGTCTGRVKLLCRTSRPGTSSAYLTSICREWRTSKRQTLIPSTSQSSRHPWKSW